MNILLVAALGSVPLVTASVAYAQGWSMMDGSTWGGGWMGGFGGGWAMILVVVIVAALVAWIVQSKGK